MTDESDEEIEGINNEIMTLPTSGEKRKRDAEKSNHKKHRKEEWIVEKQKEVKIQKERRKGGKNNKAFRFVISYTSTMAIRSAAKSTNILSPG